MREADVGADVEDGDLDRRDLALDVRDERLDVDLLARVGAEAVRLAAVGADLRDQRLELVGAAPRDAGDEAFAREAARDRAAGRVAGADDEHRLAFCVHAAPRAVWGSTHCRRTRRHLRIRGSAKRSMTARVFISYRTSDGADKATALARDLDALFGQEQIFLDKDDLPAGSRWRDEVARTLNAAPILLVLVTPNYLGARDGDGRRCIERDDDPVRDELERRARRPRPRHPAAVRRRRADAARRRRCRRRSTSSRERTWRRLRAYDWREDLAAPRRRPARARRRAADDARRARLGAAAARGALDDVAPRAAAPASRRRRVALARRRGRCVARRRRRRLALAGRRSAAEPRRPLARQRRQARRDRRRATARSSSSRSSRTARSLRVASSAVDIEQRSRLAELPRLLAAAHRPAADARLLPRRGRPPERRGDASPPTRRPGRAASCCRCTSTRPKAASRSTPARCAARSIPTATASAAASGSTASRASASSTCGASPRRAGARERARGAHAQRAAATVLPRDLRRRRRQLGERRAGAAFDRQALLAPLGHAAAEPVDLGVALGDRGARRLVRLPALRAVAEEDDRLVLGDRS